MTVHEISREQAIYHITDRTPEQMLKSISTHKKALAGGNGDAAREADKLSQRISQVEEYGGIRGTLLSLPPLQQKNGKLATRSLLSFELKQEVTVIYGGSELHADNAQRTAERLDELADRF